MRNTFFGGGAVGIEYISGLQKKETGAFGLPAKSLRHKFLIFLNYKLNQ